MWFLDDLDDFSRKSSDVESIGSVFQFFFAGFLDLKSVIFLVQSPQGRSM